MQCCSSRSPSRSSPPRRPLAFELTRHADGTPDLIDPAITANPIPVVLSIRTNVSADDEAWITGAIRDGLDLWEQVPTSHVRFVTSVGIAAPGTARPGRGDHRRHRLRARDRRGNPPVAGQSRAMAGDRSRLPGRLPRPASSSSPRTRSATRSASCTARSATSTSRSSRKHPHHALRDSGTAPGLTADDVAAISSAYPDASEPLAPAHGTVRGRCISSATGLPITGINVVAVDSSGAPASPG